jgi:hypothetical protein
LIALVRAFGVISGSMKIWLTTRYSLAASSRLPLAAEMSPRRRRASALVRPSFCERRLSWALLRARFEIAQAKLGDATGEVGGGAFAGTLGLDEEMVVGGDGLGVLLQFRPAVADEPPNGRSGLFRSGGIGDGGQEKLGVLPVTRFGEFASEVFEDLRGNGGALGFGGRVFR